MPLHPFVAQMLEMMRASPWKGVAASTPEEARKFFAARAAQAGAAPDVGKVNDLDIPTRSGAIKGRLLMPKDGKPTSLVVFYHGGGWVIGSIDDCDFIARFMIARTNCAALLVEYRLAPEHPYPTPLDDCWDGLQFAAQEAARLSVPIVLAGDSAGGNLATVCALLARDRGGPKIALQILMYPVCDCDMETPSYRENGKGYVLTAADMGWFYDHYLKGDKAKRADPLISPLRALTLAGLPPALIMSAEYDVLRDEAETYGKRLAAAGVKVWVKRYLGMTHGFIRLQNFVDVARTGMDDIVRVMAETTGAKR
ncbi:MAG TPA: alpha/beta hydrolase [Stellaceae bacterium]|nr:alpha/beta hydrolase [Stellaceae bacterium]